MRSTIKGILDDVVSSVYWVALPLQITPPDQYIIFSTRESDHFFANDAAQSTQLVCYVDFFSKTDDQAKTDQIKTLMRANGFVLPPGGEMQLYESGADYFHNSTMWNYVGVDV